MLHRGTAPGTEKIRSELLRHGCEAVASRERGIERDCAHCKLGSLSLHTGWRRSCFRGSVALCEPDSEGPKVASVPADRCDPRSRCAAVRTCCSTVEPGVENSLRHHRPRSGRIL